jgi:hypothetical protein
MRLILALLALLPTIAHATEIAVSAETPRRVPGTDITLTLTDVTDQRCPANVACMWEGMIRVELSVTSGTDAPKTIVLCNMCDGATRDAGVPGHTVSLVRLDPPVEFFVPLNRNPMLRDYTVTVDVTAEP